MTLLKAIQESVLTATQSQIDDILAEHNTTEAAVLSKPGKLAAFIGLIEKSQPGEMATRSQIVSASTSAPAPKVVTTAPVASAAPTPIAKLSASFDWDTATDEECDAEDVRLARLAARSLRKANALKLERQIAATNADIYDDEAQTIDLNQKGLDASQELAKQRAMLEVQAASAPRLLQMQIDAATSIATARITRTEAAIDAGKSAMQETPLASEIAAFRARLTQCEMMNRATSIANATPALLGAAQPEPQLVTIDA